MPTNDQHHANTPDISLEGMTLHVADVERSLEFYTKIPGVQVLVHRPGAFALLSIGNGRMGLLKYGPTHIEFDTPAPPDTTPPLSLRLRPMIGGRTQEEKGCLNNAN